MSKLCIVFSKGDAGIADGSAVMGNHLVGNFRLAGTEIDSDQGMLPLEGSASIHLYAPMATSSSTSR